MKLLYEVKVVGVAQSREWRTGDIPPAGCSIKTRLTYCRQSTALCFISWNADTCFADSNTIVSSKLFISLLRLSHSTSLFSVIIT